jgi:hypothetical protein
LEIGENCIMRSFITLLLAKHNQNDQVKEEEMDRECSTNEGDVECIIIYKWESQNK